jgi:predicted RNA methylase
MPRPVNTTLQNCGKAPRLAKTHVVPTHHISTRSAHRYIEGIDPAKYRRMEDRQAFLYSVGLRLLGPTLSPQAEVALHPYRLPTVPVGDVPTDCVDLLGSLYQYLSSKKENLAKGAFYTGPRMADDLVSGLDFSEGQTLLDPACGSGILLFQSGAPPDQLVGVDKDPVAVMVARFNYFLTYPDGPPPKIYCADFFAWVVENRERRFDYIIANPPYGANAQLPPEVVLAYANLFTSLTSGETFSYFIDFATRLLKEQGTARYLVPEALLNVKRHQDIREVLLDQFDLRRIKKYPTRFTGLVSDVYQLEIKRGETKAVAMEDETTTICTPTFIKSFKASIFSFLTEREVEIIKSVRKRCTASLSGCQFGLGVLTGNNRKFLHDAPSPGMEPIYSGKEVQPYRLLKPRKYIAFDRKSLQQVAPDAIYRAPVKLVYKMVCRTLKVALDRSGCLTTNSANIIVPDPKLMSPEALTAILNSSFASFLYVKLFGNVNKIAKTHLLALPIPEVSPAQDQWLCEQVARLPDPEILKQIDTFVAVGLYGVTESDLEETRKT